MRTKYHGSSAGAPQLELGNRARKGHVSNGRASGANGYGDEIVDSTYPNGGFRSGVTNGGYAHGAPAAAGAYDEPISNGGFRNGASNGDYANGMPNGAVEHAGPGYDTVVNANGRPVSKYVEPARNF